MSSYSCIKGNIRWEVASLLSKDAEDSSVKEDKLIAQIHRKKPETPDHYNCLVITVTINYSSGS